MIQNPSRLKVRAKVSGSNPQSIRVSSTILFILIHKRADVQNTCSKLQPCFLTKQGPPGTRLHCFTSLLWICWWVAEAFGLHLASHLLSSISVSIIAPHNITSEQQLLNCMAVILTKQGQWEQWNCQLLNKTYPLKTTATVLLHLVHSHNIERTFENQYKIFIFSNHRIHLRATLSISQNYKPITHCISKQCNPTRNEDNFQSAGVQYTLRSYKNVPTSD